MNALNLDDKARRRLVIGAEILLVVLLIGLNVVLWGRSGRDSADPAPAAAPAATNSAPAATTTTSTTTSSAPATVDGASDVDDATKKAIAGAGRVMLVVDTTSSMQAHLPTIAEGTKRLIDAAPADTAVGIVTYSPAGAAVAAEPVKLDDAGRQALARTLDGLKVSPGAARPMYDAMVLAYQRAIADARQGSTPLVIVVSDTGRSGGSDLASYATYVTVETSKKLTSGKPILIGVGSSMDMSEMRRAAEVTKGLAVAATDDEQLRGALLTFGSRSNTHGG